MRKLEILSYDREHDVLYAQFDDRVTNWVTRQSLDDSACGIERIEEPSESLIIYNFKELTAADCEKYLPPFDWISFQEELDDWEIYLCELYWELLSNTVQSETYVNILQHRAQVRFLMEKFTSQLMARAFIHDDSKFSKEEFLEYCKYIPELKEVDYGSEEYKAILSEMQPTLEHHYKNNRHHPEYFGDRVKDDNDSPVNYMNLFDLIEMYVDWKAASMRQVNGIFEKSIWHGCSKYNITEQLTKIFTNTIGE